MYRCRAGPKRCLQPARAHQNGPKQPTTWATGRWRISGMRDEATTRYCASRQRDQQMEAKRVGNQSSRCQLAQLTGKRDDERHPCTGPIWNIEDHEVRECTELTLEWAARRWNYG